ncbi:MAG: Lar family restriction alleviation protein [Paracoccaceae bacterium]
MNSPLSIPVSQCKTLASCPFCGSTGALLTPTGTPGHRSISCVGCNADGPTKRTTALAWASWNDRKAVA